MQAKALSREEKYKKLAARQESGLSNTSKVTATSNISITPHRSGKIRERSRFPFVSEVNDEAIVTLPDGLCENIVNKVCWTRFGRFFRLGVLFKVPQLESIYMWLIFD